MCYKVSQTLNRVKSDNTVEIIQILYRDGNNWHWYKNYFKNLHIGFHCNKLVSSKSKNGDGNGDTLQIIQIHIYKVMTTAPSFTYYPKSYIQSYDYNYFIYMISLIARIILKIQY